MKTKFFNTTRGYKLAYVHTKKTNDDLPAVMFLGGFKSDMEGTKALYLQELCTAHGQEFIRFDYAGHGKSEGGFTDGTIDSWTQDACDILDQIMQRHVILVGSSMGGWIALLLMLKRPERLHGVIGIAAAPDFTRDIITKMNQGDHETMERLGRLEIPNNYSAEPYIFTRKLLENGEKNCLLDKTHDIDTPLILLQGKRDSAVAWEKALQIKNAFPGDKTKIMFIDDGEHNLSRDQDLKLLKETIQTI